VPSGGRGKEEGWKTQLLLCDIREGGGIRKVGDEGIGKKEEKDLASGACRFPEKGEKNEKKEKGRPASLGYSSQGEEPEDRFSLRKPTGSQGDRKKRGDGHPSK